MQRPQCNVLLQTILEKSFDKAETLLLQRGLDDDNETMILSTKKLLENAFDDKSAVKEGWCYDLTKWVLSLCKLVWQMTLQHPPMTFEIPRIGGKVDMENDKIIPQRKMDFSRMQDYVIDYYLEPHLMHGASILELGRVKVCLKNVTSVSSENEIDTGNIDKNMGITGSCGGVDEPGSDNQLPDKPDNGQPQHSENDISGNGAVSTSENITNVSHTGCENENGGDNVGGNDVVGHNDAEHYEVESEDQQSESSEGHKVHANKNEENNDMKIKDGQGECDKSKDEKTNNVGNYPEGKQNSGNNGEEKNAGDNNDGRNDGEIDEGNNGERTKDKQVQNVENNKNKSQTSDLKSNEHPQQESSENCDTKFDSSAEKDDKLSIAGGTNEFNKPETDVPVKCSGTNGVDEKNNFSNI